MSSTPGWFMQYIWVPVLGIVGTVLGWLRLADAGRVAAIEEAIKTKVDKSAFDDHLERVEVMRVENRRDIKELFHELGAARKEMNEGFQNLMKAVYEGDRRHKERDS